MNFPASFCVIFAHIELSLYTYFLIYAGNLIRTLAHESGAVSYWPAFNSLVFNSFCVRVHPRMVHIQMVFPAGENIN